MLTSTIPIISGIIKTWSKKIYSITDVNTVSVADATLFVTESTCRITIDVISPAVAKVRTIKIDIGDDIDLMISDAMSNPSP